MTAELTIISILIWVLYLLEEFILIKPISTMFESKSISKYLELAAFWYLPIGMIITISSIYISGNIILFGIINIIGILLCVFGLGLRFWSRRELGRFFTIGVIKQENHKVIQTGPYQYIRHPAYLAFIIFYFGFTLISGNWLGLFFLFIPAVVIFSCLIIVEDAHLAETIGEEYREYQKKTYRIIPYIW